MMMLWAWAGVPLGVYNIVKNFNVALRIQPQILTTLSLITWIQCYYYEKVCLCQNDGCMILANAEQALECMAISSACLSHCMRYGRCPSNTYHHSSYRKRQRRTVADNIDGGVLCCVAGRGGLDALLGYLHSPNRARHIVPVCLYRCHGRPDVVDLCVLPTKAGCAGHGHLRNGASALARSACMRRILQLGSLVKNKAQELKTAISLVPARCWR